MKDPLENIPQWGCLRLAVGFVARSPWFHRLFLSRGSAGGQARCGLRLRSGGGEHVSDALGRSEAVAGAVQVLFRGRVTQRSACSMFFFPRSQHEQWPSNFISYKSAHWIISPFTSIKIKGFVQAIAELSAVTGLKPTSDCCKIHPGWLRCWKLFLWHLPSSSC